MQTVMICRSIVVTSTESGGASKQCRQPPSPIVMMCILRGLLPIAQLLPERNVALLKVCWVSQERVSTQFPVDCLASLYPAHSLSGMSFPVAAMQHFLRGKKPSNSCQVSSQGSSSHEVNRVLSWMHPRCRRFRVKRDTCVTHSHPSSNLGRNLSPVRGFLTTPDSAAFNATSRQPSHIGGSLCTPRVPGLRAVVRCSCEPRGGQTM
jgi:hypothetical protein